MSTLDQKALLANIPSDSSPQNHGRPAAGPPLAELQPRRPEDSVDDGPAEDGLYVSADSTPAENVRWLMLFQAF